MLLGLIMCGIIQQWRVVSCSNSHVCSVPYTTMLLRTCTNSALEESEFEDNDDNDEYDEYKDASDSPQGYHPSNESTPNNATSSTVGSRSGSGRASGSAQPGRKLSRPTGVLQLTVDLSV
jgi:hypothetical protein